MDSATLAAVTTSSTIADRVIGTSQLLAASVEAILVLCGNTIRLSDELARRAVWIHLDAGPDPTSRRAFRYPDLRKTPESEWEGITWCVTDPNLDQAVEAKADRSARADGTSCLPGEHGSRWAESSQCGS